MNLRKSCLPAGWYPQTARGVSRFFDGIPRENPGGAPALAAAAPHAGWHYSGAIAARAVLSLDREAETVAVIGGHLPGGLSPLIAGEEALETPLGEMPLDRDLGAAVFQTLGCKPDRYADNTVEVLAPMVHCLFPGTKLLWLRFPADKSAFDAGRELARIAKKLGRKLVVLGSTDLTHYGENYQFAPRGEGEKALAWVREVNDARFIAAVKSGDPEEILRRAEEDRSACSAGAVLGALGFARETGAANGELLAYGTSADQSPGEVPASFVGYGAFCWRRRAKVRPNIA
ncbi:MAG: AmmeMemoRadiSam system protein B [Treponema sp.]|nr:AmmeMemoRadiSam system protein B [Treponema sp.]